MEQNAGCLEANGASIRPVNPLQLLLLCFAGWIHRHQQDLIEYLQEEIKVLREQLGSLPPNARRSRIFTPALDSILTITAAFQPRQLLRPLLVCSIA